MFSLKKIMWTNEKLTKEQFVEVRGTIYEFESSRLRVRPRALPAKYQNPRLRGWYTVVNYEFCNFKILLI